MDDPVEVPAEWIRNEADRQAIAAGAKWQPERGEHFIDTVESNFRLYEGTKFAGKLVTLMNWQKDYFMRLFSWVMWSEFNGAWLRRFRRARLWVPKKNGKSPMAAMVGLYLTVADGEMGGKTYSAAKDGKQARIVHDHAIKMVEQSPELMRACEINKTEKRITHVDSLSWYGVLSSDGNVESQEGLNGNAIIDEGHVVDRKLADTLEFMGASRDEPLEFMVSTAGKNMMGWGRSQWEYGEQVNAGKNGDLEFLHQCYAAKPTATDDELMDPEAARAANPSLGHILNPEAFERELKIAKRKSAKDWANFKMYRFNIWQSSSSPWIESEHWNACADIFDLSQFRGSPVFIGYDASKSSDLTCAQIIVPVAREGWGGDQDDEEGKIYYLWPMLYVTRAAVDKFGDKVAFEKWSDAGDITIIEANQIDFARVRRDVIDAVEDNDLDVQCITYDPTYATETAQGWADRFDCPHVDFRQSVAEWAEPTESFERLLKLHLLRHPGNEVLNWQAGHVEISNPTRQGWCMPVKPQVSDKLESRQAHATIDGITSAVMGLREARKFEPDTSAGLCVL